MAFNEDCSDNHDDIKNQLFEEYKIEMCSLRDEILNIYSEKFPSKEDKLKRTNISKENKKIREEIDAQEVELAKHKRQYESYKKDQELLSKELKATHEAFLTAKKYYKMHLKIYYTIEARNGDEQTIFVQFFTEAKKQTDLYSIRLLRDTKTKVYQLLESNPKLDEEMELKKTLQDTKDLPGTLYAIRQAFIKIKSKKNDE